MHTILWVHEPEHDNALNAFIGESPLPLISMSPDEAGLQNAQDGFSDVGIVFYRASRSAHADSAQRLKQRLMRKGKLITLVYLVPSTSQSAVLKAIEWGGDDAMAWPCQNVENVLARVSAICHFHQRLDALQLTNRQLVHQQSLVSEELKVVERVFDNVINRPKADLNHVQTYMSPMARFNGDLCLVLGSPSGDTYVLLGDFTGHGLSAAIGSLPVSDIFYAMVAKGVEVDEIAREINRKLLNILPDSMFLCAIVLRVNRSHTYLQMWGGGMYDLLVLSQNHEQESREKDKPITVNIERLASQCMPLGILSEDEFESTVIDFPLGKNMKLFAHSDGLVEAENATGEQLSESRLERLLRQSADLLSTDESLIDRVLAAFQSFVGHSNPTDDVSMVEISCGKAIDVWESKQLPDHFNDSNGFSAGSMASKSIVPWHFAAVLAPQDLRNSEVTIEVMELLRSCRLDESSLGLVHTVFSELFNNALEHGLLKLSSEQKASAQGFEEYYLKREQRLATLNVGEIRINIHLVPSIDQSDQYEVEMTISDTGEGYTPNLHAVDDDLAHGRGLFLLKSLCRRIEMSNRGRTVTVSLSVNLLS